MQSTRQRVINYLEANHLGTVHEISRVFGMTPANLRHHLNLLIQAGLVEVVGQRSPSGRGRPTLVFALTSKADNAGLDRLTQVLLEELLLGNPGSQQANPLRRIAARLVGGQTDRGSNLTQRLYETIRRLRGMQYKARWEAHVDGPRIILDRCPFASLTDRRPEICQLDSEVVTMLLGEKVELLTTRSRTPMGPKHCIFRVEI